MIKRKNKNKIARKLVLSTLSLSSLVGVGLTTFAFNVDNSKNEISNVSSAEIDNDINVDSRNIVTKLQLKSTIVPANFYPFEIDTPTASDPGNFYDFFEIVGSVNQTTAGVSIQYGTPSIDVLQNNGSGSKVLGMYSIQIKISSYEAAGGAVVNVEIPLSGVARGFKSVTEETRVIPKIDTVPSINEYASDKIDVLNASRFVTWENQVEVNNIANSNKYDTTLRTIKDSVTFNNISGTLTVASRLQNYIGSLGTYQTGDSPIIYTPINGFKKIYGETILETIPGAVSTTIPSVLLKDTNNGSLREALIEAFFTLKYPLTIRNNLGAEVPSTKIKKVVISEPNDKDGTLKVTLTVTGGYYTKDPSGLLIPVRSSAPTDEGVITFTVGNFGKFVDPGDESLILVVAGISGGVAFIGIIIALIFFIRFQKRKNEQVRKKKSMEDKLQNMSSAPKKGPLISNATSGISPGSAPGSRPGGPGGPNKYVPPTISIPKSNAPVVKRPSAPLPPPIKK